MAHPRTFDLHGFYQTKVRPHLGELNALRRTAILYGFLGFPLIALAVVGIILIASQAAIHPAGPIAAIVLGLGSIPLFSKSFAASREFRRLYKSAIVREIIKAYDDTYSYDPDGCIQQTLYRASGLFPRNYDAYSGDDLISGKMGETDFTFSELHTQYKTESTNSKGERTTTWHTIFRGFFFVADFHKDFSGRTYVLPDQAEKLFGKWLGQGIQSWSGSFGQLVKLEDVRFEQEFVTYSNDQQEARYVLTPSMMERVLKLKQSFDSDLRFGFVQGKVFVAIPRSGNMFEASIFSAAPSFDEIAMMYRTLETITGIVDELNLNTRIWSKE